MERIELLHAHDRGIVDLVFLPVFGEVVVDLAGTEDQALGERGGRLRSGIRRFRIGPLRIVDDLLEMPRRELVDARGRGGIAEKALGRHHDQRLAETSPHLAPQCVKILGGSREVAHLPVALGAELQEPLETGGRVFRPLAFIAVGEEEHDAAHTLPLGFGAGDELVDDGLRAIREIAKLRLPQAEHLGIIEAVTVVEAEHAGLGQR